MKFDLQCPACNHVVNVPASLGGGQTTCLRCGARLLVPEADEAQEAFDARAAKALEAFVAGQSQSNDPNAEPGEIDFNPLPPEPDAQSANPFASPRFGGRPDDSQFPLAPALIARPTANEHRPMFSLSAKELYDLVVHAETTRKYVVFFFWLLVLLIVLQIISIVIAAIAISKATSPTETGEGTGALITNVVVALIYGLAAALLQEYSENLGTFVHSRRPHDLVVAMRSGGSYWKTTALATAGLIVLGIVAVVVVVLVLVTLQPNNPRQAPAPQQSPFRFQ
jgi:hypothetical protein